MLKQNLPTFSSRLILALLAAAVLLQDGVWIVVLRVAQADWPAWQAVVAMGLAFSQVTVAAVLALWWVRWLLARGVLVVLNVALAGYLAARCTNDDVSNWIGIMGFTAGLVAAPLAIFRLAGVRLVATAHPEPLPAGARQFTIWGLLSLTTIVAVALGVARFMAFPWEEIGQIGLFVLALGTIPWVASTLALSRWPAVNTIAITAVVCPLVGWGMSFTGFPPDHPRELIAMTCVQGILTLGICSAVRAAGFHVAWL